jgi:hypothetical protein
MNTRQIELVQSSFAQVAPIAGVAASLFYDRLFELDPALRGMFRRTAAYTLLGAPLDAGQGPRHRIYR